MSKKAAITLRLNGRLGEYETAAPHLKAHDEGADCEPFDESKLNSFHKVSGTIVETPVDYFRPSDGECVHYVSTEIVVEFEDVPLVFRGVSRSESVPVESDMCR